MNGIKPTIGIEFDDKYLDAKAKLIDFVKVFITLDAGQKERLAKEFMTSFGMATSFEQFVNYMNNGGRL